MLNQNILLLIRNKIRYLTKGNYNITRLEYILEIFPDALFVVPIRHPITHVISLVKQHKIFLQGATFNPKLPNLMKQMGHFEFGQNRLATHLGDSKKFQQINNLLNNGDDIGGFALQWDSIYSFLKGKMEENEKLKKAIVFIRFEDLCKNPNQTILNLEKHCKLKHNPEIISDYEVKIKYPKYYELKINENDLEKITQFTKSTASYFDYPLIKNTNELFDYIS